MPPAQPPAPPAPAPYPDTPAPATPYPATPYPADPYQATPYPPAPTAGYPAATGYPAEGYPAQTAYPTSGYGGYAGYGTQAGYPYAYPPAQKTNGLAIGSMVTSIIGTVLLICYGLGGLAGLVGAILGHVARRQIRERQEAGDGMALAGIIVGWITFALSLIVVGLVVALFATFATVPAPSDDFDSFLRAPLALLTQPSLTRSSPSG